MQVTVEKPGGLQRRLTVQVPGDELRQKIDARLREIGKTAKLKGFRPGRVPMSVLKQRYGPSVRNEIVSQTLESSLYRAIEQEALRPASNPVIENVSDARAEQDLEFTATIEVYPDIGKIDTSGLTINDPATEVTEADVQDMLQTLREQRQSWAEVERPAGEGDQVVFEYTADTSAGSVPASGRKRMGVVLTGTGLEKLEKVLTGAKQGDQLTVKQSFPEGFADPDLAGEAAKLHLEVVSVQQRNLPEVDADFIRSYSIESGELDDMLAEVRNNLERELLGARVTYLKMQLLDGLLEAHAELEVPEGLVREEASQLVRRDAQRRGVEPNPATAGNFTDIARKRVKSALLLGEIARQNDILVDGARVRKAVETIADTYEQSREVVQMYYGNPQLMSAVESSVLEEQVVDWVLDHAKVERTPMSFKELIDAAAQARVGS